MGDGLDREHVIEARRRQRLAAAAEEDLEEAEATLDAAGPFFLARAEKEHEAAERKREAAMTKATAIAALAAALAALVATPTLDGSGLADSGRWLLLGAVGSFLGAILCVAIALLIHVKPGERVSQVELGNWTTEKFWLTDVVTHAFDLTLSFVRATRGIRRANRWTEVWLTVSTAAIALGLVLVAVAFTMETT